MSGDENKWLNGYDDRWSVGEKKGVMERHLQEQQLGNVIFLKKWV